jgi:hypothetical protein
MRGVIVVAARKLDKDTRLMSNSPRIMSRRKKHDVARTKFLGGTIVHHNVECPREYDSNVRQLTNAFGFVRTAGSEIRPYLA